MRISSREVVPSGPGRRRGTVLPMIAVSLGGIFAFTALAVDLGMLAVSRTECQNVADASALAGCRTLNNTSSSANSNLPAAVAAVNAVVPANYDMGANYTANQITEIAIGQYLYSTSTQSFAIYNGQGQATANLGWANSNTSPTPATGSWTAIQVTISYTQPMTFLTIFGVNSMPTGAVAAGVFRPRDTAFVLDMTGSMAYASQFNYNNTSNNPDTMVPRFGHYVSTRTNCIQTSNQTTSDGQAISRNNYCIYTPDGLPIIRDYVYDPTNISNPATSAYPITSNTSSLMNAFHRWGGSLANSTSGSYPPESGANNDTYLGPVYNFTGYNAFDTTGTYGPTPAPDSFIDQFDNNGNGATITYVGDRYPRLSGQILTTPTSWAANTAGAPYPLNNPTPAWNDTTNGAAYNDHSYLGGSAFSSVPSISVTTGSGRTQTTATYGTPYISSTSLSSPTSYTSTWNNYRDPAWETFGYDLMMGPGTKGSAWPSYCSTTLTYPTYQALRNSQTASGGGNNNKTYTTGYTPINPSGGGATASSLPVTTSGATPGGITSSMCFACPTSLTYSSTTGTWQGVWPQGTVTANPSGTSANMFKGYSMGPGYWGKTFWIWPPDPRFSTSATLTSPNQYCPAFDTSGNAMCDWRRHFFLSSSGAALSTQSSTSINSTLFNTSSSGSTLKGSGFTVNYPAVLAWIKAGPQVFPPNLRAGRIIFYSSIPSVVTSSSGDSAQVALDKVFWQNYIDYVLGANSYNYSNNNATPGYLYGDPDNWSSATISIGSTSAIQYPWDSKSIYPYMNYNDSPLRPRLNFWFGPMSMCDFISGVFNGGNWNPGTIHEAQCWQLKVAMNSVISDVQTNHPNDTLGMVMFSAAAYNGPRVGQGQNYTALQNALFYPNSLLYNITYNGDVTTEECPYDTNMNNTLAGNEIPNACGSTDPNTGMAYAFNILSASNQLTQTSTTTGPFSTSTTSIYGTARRGASKMVILETDGVPNTYRSNSIATGMGVSKHGYDTYYPASSTNSVTDLEDGASQTMTYAVNIATQMALPMATSGQTSGSTATSGLSLSNAQALVYPIAFGDLFDPVISPDASMRPTALQFLANVAAAGNTGTSGATSLPSGQVIIGDYQTRISTLQTCLQDIFQSGVTVALIE